MEKEKEEEEHALSDIVFFGVRAVAESMRILRPYQTLDLGLDDVQTKENDTLVTCADYASDAAAQEFLRLLAIPIASEDTLCQQGVIESNRVLLVDSLDGTGAFAARIPTSTVIVACYNRRRSQVEVCVIGAPSMKTIWWATRDASGLFKRGMGKLGLDGFHFIASSFSVWQGFLKSRPTVFLDVSHGFEHDSHQCFTDGQIADLFAGLNRRTKVLLPGSNGLMHALVATGGEKLAGGVTTALGGPWDACGILLVLAAGGVARAFQVNAERELDEKDPLDVLSYDLVVFGNSQETVDWLVGRVKEVF